MSSLLIKALQNQAMVYLLLFLSYLSGSKSVSPAYPPFRPSDPDMMTMTALEAIASSNDKKKQYKKIKDYLWNGIIGLIILILNNVSINQYSGDQATLRPHILCSMCILSFEALAKAVRLFVHCIISQPASALKCAQLTFSSISNQLTEMRKGGLFDLLVWGTGHVGAWIGPSIAHPFVRQT